MKPNFAALPSRFWVLRGYAVKHVGRHNEADCPYLSDEKTSKCWRRVSKGKTWLDRNYDPCRVGNIVDRDLLLSQKSVARAMENLYPDARAAMALEAVEFTTEIKMGKVTR